MMQPMVNIVLGTRGQFVKMAPVFRELDKRNIPYRIIHTGQHTASTKEMATVFCVRQADVFLTKRTSDITSIRNALFWFCVCFVNGLRLDPGQRACSANAMVVHGDTLSTLLGCMLSFFWGQRLVHVESGLTTGALFTPFPEEIIRRICVACAQVLYAPGEWAAENCRKRKAKGIVFSTGANTVLDSVRYIRETAKGTTHRQPYGIVTLHRNETFFSRKNAAAAIDTVTGVARTWKLLFVMHRLTERRLKKYGLFDRVSRAGTIEILGYQRYDEFMGLVSNASFVMTDGGGLQEETCYLNVPCIVLRSKTERKEGLDSTALLSGVSGEAVAGFVNSLATRPRPQTERKFSSIHPAQSLVDHLLATFPGDRAPDET
jgi:UDP-N-acetylglucosamine 2-epimerase (non-hydrolysing)